MKGLNKTVALLLCAAFILASLYECARVEATYGRTDNNTSLPVDCANFLSGYFNGIAMTDMVIDGDMNYVVTLADSSIIYFTPSGRWRKILCSHELPHGIVSESIENYVYEHYTDDVIVSAEMEDDILYIVTRNGVRLKYNTNDIPVGTAPWHPVEGGIIHVPA